MNEYSSVARPLIYLNNWNRRQKTWEDAELRFCSWLLKLTVKWGSAFWTFIRDCSWDQLPWKRKKGKKRKQDWAEGEISLKALATLMESSKDGLTLPSCPMFSHDSQVFMTNGLFYTSKSVDYCIWPPPRRGITLMELTLAEGDTEGDWHWGQLSSSNSTSCSCRNKPSVPTVGSMWCSATFTLIDSISVQMFSIRYPEGAWLGTGFGSRDLKLSPAHWLLVTLARDRKKHPFMKYIFVASIWVTTHEEAITMQRWKGTEFRIKRSNGCEDQ